MNTALVKRALEIVDDALELDAMARQTYLQSACGDDDQLRQEVELFLQHEGGLEINSPDSDFPLVQIPDSASPEDRYEFGGEIARGGMGAVVWASDSVLERDVAVKILLKQHAANPDLIRRFVTESRIGARLQHPGIAPVYDLGRLGDGRPFFAMKLVRGETLADLLSNRCPSQADESRLLAIFEQLCQTVAYAHSRDIIHRDLKPANIMVGQFGEVQLMDWGLAKVLDGIEAFDGDQEAMEFRRAFDATGSLPGPEPERPSRKEENPLFRETDSPWETRFGVVMGTPAYMPPEQIAGRRGKTTDVYSLGAILCEILTGQPPCNALTPTQVCADSVQGKVVEALQRVDECNADDALKEIVKHCLAIAPTDRYQDAGEVAHAISNFVASARARLKQAELDTLRAQTVLQEERKRRRWTLIAAVLCVALILLASGGWLWMSSEQNRRERISNLQQARRAAEVQEALTEAEALWNRANQAPIDQLEPWIEARAAIARALTLVRTESVDAQQAQEAQLLNQAIARGESERKLVLAIDDAREAVFANPDSPAERNDRIRDQLESTFRHHELHPDLASIDKAAIQIREFSPDVQDVVCGALDQWLLHARMNHQAWLFDVLATSDRNDWRAKWRMAHARNDHRQLESLFRNPELRHQSARNILNLHQSVRETIPATDQISLLKVIQPLHASDFWFNTRLAELVWNQNRSFDALIYYTAAAAIRPSGPLHARIGDIMLALDRQPEAWRHFARSELLERDLHGQWTELTMAIQRAADFDEAIALVQQAIDEQPDSIIAHTKLASLLRLAGKPDEAVEVMQRIVAIHPRDFWALFHQAEYVSSLGDPGRTVVACEPLLQFADSRKYGSQVRNRSERALSSALMALEQCLGQSPQNDDSCLFFAEQALHWMQIYLSIRKPGTWQRLLNDQRFAIVRDADHLNRLPSESRHQWEQFWTGIRSRIALDRENAEIARQSIEDATWHRLRPSIMQSLAGADLTLLQDDSIIVSGKHEADDSYIIEAMIDPGYAAALRLEVLTDPTLPNQGPGRHETGNFQLSEIRLELMNDQSGKWESKTFSSAVASYSWRERPVDRAIDDNVLTAWHVWGEIGKPHWAVFTLDEPIKATEPVKIRMTLRHGGDLGPGLGRFRLAVSPESF